MEERAMCRVCLTEDIRMRLIANTHLQEMYESLTLLPLETKDSRPIRACYICCAGLQNCYLLRKRCLRSEDLLTRMVSSGLLQPINVQDSCTQILRVEHSVIHLSIGDVLQNKTDDATIEKSANPADFSDVVDDVKAKQEDAEDIKMEPREETEAQIANDVQYSHLEDPLDIMKREPDETDIKMEPGEEHDPQIDEDEQCAHLEDPLDVMKSEPDDVETETKDIILEIEDITLEANYGEPDVAGPSSQSEDIELALEPMASKVGCIGIPESNKCRLATRRIFIENSSRKLQVHIAETAKTSLQCHNRTRTGEKQFQCHLCNKSFTRKFNLTRHIHTHTGEKQFQCDMCNKSFWDKCNLTQHMYTHTGERPFQCDLCNQYFRFKCNLTQHMYTHTSHKQFQCDMCNKCFTSQRNLTQHTDTHTGKKLLQCNVCNKILSRKGRLKSHMRIHTGEKPFMCDICQKCFSDHSSLKVHIRTHTGEKPYTCEICQKSFRHRNALREHIRTHTGEKPYMCDMCTKCFIQKNALKLHMRKHLIKNVLPKTVRLNIIYTGEKL